MVLYGHRSRVALLLPHEDYTTEVEFNKLAPEGVAFYSTRMILESSSPEAVVRMANELDYALKRLPPRVDLIVYHCTSGSFVQGPEWESQIMRDIERKTGSVATTTMTAVVQGIKELGLKRIALCSPYVEELNRKARDYLDQYGIEVAQYKGLGMTNTEQICALEQGDIYRLARSLKTDDVDGLFVSCTGLKTLGLVDVLERDLAKPVVTSNSATFWHILNKSGVRQTLEQGYGGLLRAKTH